MPVRRGKDSHGSFYQWGSQKRYYYTPGDARSRSIAKGKATRQGEAIHIAGYRGGAISLNPYENLQRVGRFILGRTPQSPALDRFLREHGSEVIQTIVVGRVPIQGALRTALTGLTLGGLAKIPYDKLWHLFAIVTTSKGTKAMIEKNEVIRIVPGETSIRADQGGEAILAYSRGAGKRHLTVNEFFGNAIRAVGPAKFFTYRAFSENCQNWIMVLLRSSGILTPQAQAFILQDTKAILEHVPKSSVTAANFLTDLAARFRLLAGEGVGRSAMKRRLVAAHRTRR